VSAFPAALLCGVTSAKMIYSIQNRRFTATCVKEIQLIMRHFYYYLLLEPNNNGVAPGLKFHFMFDYCTFYSEKTDISGFPSVSKFILCLIAAFFLCEKPGMLEYFRES
jgi:hypothetical protein